MATYSLDCPNCGAPLSLANKQSIAICVYCNSSVLITIAKDAPPVITKIKEISFDVVDEVKRLIILGTTTKAINYYAKQSGVTQAEASIAINNIKKTTGYQPPLNTTGIVRIILFILFGVLVAIGGLLLIMNSYEIAGIPVGIFGLLFIFVNLFAFSSSFKAYQLLKNGIEANAKIIKRWEIKTMKATGKRPEATIVRMLLEVQPENQKPYLSEANGLLGEISLAKCQVGYTLKVKYDKEDPKRIVISAIK